MLSNNIPATPRPRPPARARRTSTPSHGFPPPPPYAPRLDMLVDSSLSIAAQLESSAVTDAPNPSPGVDEWINERSRGELSNLLVKADGIIKSRESELSLTSALCRSLHHDNVALKTKHDALLSRIPFNNGRSPSPPLPSPSPLPSPLSHSPHYYSGSLPHSAIHTPLSASPPVTSFIHYRKASVTPGEIAILADQNAELIDKLEKLEQESEQADQAGKRKLRKLEKEIQGLREELDKTQAKGAELEEKAKAAQALTESAEAQRKKEEREERARALREKLGASSEHATDELRDFAPPSELPRSTSFKLSPREVESPPPALNLSTKPLAQSANLQPGTESPSYPSSGISSPVQLEYALVSQLLSKIRELEETNAQITDEQKATAERLRSAQQEAENIRQAYKSLEEDDDEEFSLAPESPTAEPLDSAGSTIKSSSPVKPSFLPGTLPEDDLQGFESGISKDMRSTTRSVVGPNVPPTNNKLRKSVVGLFDPEARSQKVAVASPHRRPVYPTTLSVSPSFRIGTPPSPTGLGDMSMWSTAATEGVDPASPAYSVLGLSSSLEAPLTSARGHTLGSELGSEYGDDWGENAGNHHLRTTSLLDLTGVSVPSTSPVIGPQILFSNSSPSPSPSPSSSPSPSPIAPLSVFSLDEEEFQRPRVASTSGSVTPPTRHGRGGGGGGLQLQLHLEPPTPELTKSAPALGSGSRATTISRNTRLSQTVRARTNRWVEARYPGMGMTAVSVPAGVLRHRKSRVGMGHAGRGSDASVIMGETFHTVARQFSMSRLSARALEVGASDVDEGDVGDEEEDGEEKRSVSTATVRGVRRSARGSVVGGGTSASSAAGAVVKAEKKKDGFVGFVLEVWLWLQFAIVVVVFLWAMAKRGPKSVLVEAERRRDVVVGGRR